MLGNLRTFEALGDKEKMQELESRLAALGYSNEDNCEKNRDIERLTWHIYDIPRQINFSVLTKQMIAIMQEYSTHFDGRVGVSAEKIEE